MGRHALRPATKRALMGGAGTWTPKDVPGLQLWLDASRLGLADGDAVATWADLSGRGRNATAAGAARPTYKTGILNGRGVVRFNGSSNIIATAAFAAALAQPLTVFVVFTLATAGADQFIFDTDASGANRVALYHDKASSAIVYFAGAAPAYAAATPVAAGVHTVLFNGASSQIWLDGASKDTNNAGADAMGGLTLGAAFFGASFATCDIAEVLVYGSALSATNRARIESYLKSKWGTP